MPSRYDELNDPDWLREKYHSEGLTQSEIAEEIGCGNSSVARYMKKHGIETKQSEGKITLKCDECGDEFKRHSSQFGDGNTFCSTDCMAEWKKGQKSWIKYPELEDPDWIRQKHFVEGLSYKEIADLVGCSEQNVSKRAREHGIQPLRERYQELGDAEWLYKKHHEEIMQLDEIAEIVGCTRSAVGYAMRRNGIDIRGGNFGKFLDDELSSESKYIIDGELLGDGSIPKPKGTAFARFSYGTAKKGYRDWLANWFEEQGFTVRRDEYLQDVDREGWSESMSYRFATHSYHCLYRFRKRLYPGGKKQVPDDLKLTPLMVRHWYIGDGTYANGEVILYTDGFDRDSADHLCSQIEKEIGFEPTINHRGAIYFAAQESTDRFFEYMTPLPNELENVYGYKWPT